MTRKELLQLWRIQIFANLSTSAFTLMNSTLTSSSLKPSNCIVVICFLRLLVGLVFKISPSVFHQFVSKSSLLLPNTYSLYLFVSTILLSEPDVFRFYHMPCDLKRTFLCSKLNLMANLYDGCYLIFKCEHCSRACLENSDNKSLALMGS